MTAINLKNITIKKLEDKNFNTYFLILNNDNQDEAFFCFKETIKDGWDNLTKNWESIREVELEFTEKESNFKTYRKVIGLYANDQGDIFF